MLDNKKISAKLKYHAIQKFPFLSGLISQTPLIILDNLPNAALTTGEKIYMRKDILKTFDDAFFIFMHEVLHVALMHPVRAMQMIGKNGKKEWHTLYNLLADARVNQLLQKENVNPTDRELSVTENNIMDFIKKHHFRFKKNVDKQTQQLFEGIAGDDETAWERAYSLARNLLEYKPPKAPPQPTIGFVGVDLSDPQSGDGGTPDKQGNSQSPMTQQQFQQIAKKLEDSIREKMLNTLIDAKMRGTDPGELFSVFEELYMTYKIRWGKIIRNCLLKALRRQPDSNHMHKKAIASGFKFALPALRRKPDAYHIALAIDTSGSMSDDELKEIAAEILGLRKHHNVVIDLFMCDSALQKEFYDLKDMKDLDKALSTMHGRGGTSFKPVFKKIRKLKKIRSGKRDYKSLVYFSDMESDQHEIKPIRDVKTWWVVPKNSYRKDDIPFGKSIVLN